LVLKKNISSCWARSTSCQ